MRNAFFIFLLSVAVLSALSWSRSSTEQTIADGKQPQISTDVKGMIRIVYGLRDKIFCVTSTDRGTTFSSPVLIGEMPGMHLGMSRGPQLASSANYSVVTAMDRAGNIHWYRLQHSSGVWKNMGMLNDVKGSAPEGLMHVAADKNDHFYAVWLDLRTGKHNQVYFADLYGVQDRWSKNRLVYQSPDEHVCECCKPNIAVQGSEVVIMFRNWLKGSRDLYVLRSANNGKSFSPAEKLGMDTWKLNACPMDGGGIVIDPSEHLKTVWQRKGTIYYCEPGQPELAMGEGRICSISGNNAQAVIAYQTRDTLKLVSLQNKQTQVVGSGSSLKPLVLPDNKIVCVWEENDKIKFRSL